MSGKSSKTEMCSVLVDADDCEWINVQLLVKNKVIGLLAEGFPIEYASQCLLCCNKYEAVT